MTTMSETDSDIMAHPPEPETSLQNAPETTLERQGQVSQMEEPVPVPDTDVPTTEVPAETPDEEAQNINPPDTGEGTAEEVTAPPSSGL
jgi:hypothetical protein